MLLSEARPRPYRQPDYERRFNQEETDKEYFDKLRAHAEWNKKHGEEFFQRYKHSFSDKVTGKNPRLMINARIGNIIRDGIKEHYTQHIRDLLNVCPVSVHLYDAYHDSFHIEFAVNVMLNVGRPLEQDINTEVTPFKVSGDAGNTHVKIEKDTFTGKSVNDALFDIRSSAAGPLYNKVLNNMSEYAWDDNGDDGLGDDNEFLFDDPEYTRLLNEVDKVLDAKVLPIVKSLIKQLNTLKLDISKHLQNYYK